MSLVIESPERLARRRQTSSCNALQLPPFQCLLCTVYYNHLLYKFVLALSFYGEIVPPTLRRFCYSLRYYILMFQVHWLFTRTHRYS